MGKKRRLVIITVTVVLLCGLAWLRLRPTEREPVYQGKPLSAWLEIYDPAATNRDHQQWAESQLAIRELGTNSIPALLRMLRRHDSPLKLKLIALAQKQSLIKVHHIPDASRYERAATAIHILGPKAESAVPELVQIFDRNLSPTSQQIIARVLGAIGPGAKAAVPSLVRGAASTNNYVRLSSLHSLGLIHSDAGLVVPVLITALQDTNSRMGGYAAASLQHFGPEAKAAVPALVKFLESNPPTPNNSIYTGINDGDLATGALLKIDPETAAKVLTNSKPPLRRWKP